MAITAGRKRNLRAFQMFMGGIKSPATKKYMNTPLGTLCNPLPSKH